MKLRENKGGILYSFAKAAIAKPCSLGVLNNRSVLTLLEARSSKIKVSAELISSLVCGWRIPSVHSYAAVCVCVCVIVLIFCFFSFDVDHF